MGLDKTPVRLQPHRFQCLYSHFHCHRLRGRTHKAISRWNHFDCNPFQRSRLSHFQHGRKRKGITGAKEKEIQILLPGDVRDCVGHSAFILFIRFSNFSFASSLPTLGTSFFLGFSQGKGRSLCGDGECFTCGLMLIAASILMRSHSACSWSSRHLRHAE